jgi:pimeloyl-ACP methyl ester carboxylesterase/DNA-binding CsgD family transcriptional regulator
MPVSMGQTAAELKHQIRFCTAADGVRIAYASGGSGLPLIKTPNWLNHLELDVHSPVWRSWIERISRQHCLVRYDARGCGLSDRLVGQCSFASNQLDLQAVVDATGLERFVLYGASQGAAIAIEYAARHPERVSHLVLCGAYLRGVMKRDPSPLAIEEAHTMVKLIQMGWGRANSAFRQVFATQFIPDSTLEQLQGFDEIQRQTATSAVAAHLLATFQEIDVSDFASDVRCPTLVLHAHGDARVPFDEGMRVAAAIPGAEFVPLDSRNHILLDHQPAWRQFFNEVDAFLLRHGAPPPPQTFTLDGLTTSEMRVLDRIAAGLNNGQIAVGLGISPKTVRNHINHIFSKLAVRDRAQAIVRGRDAGLGRVVSLG